MPTTLITGASGFIGQLLATQLLTTHPKVDSNKLILTDLHAPPIPKHTRYPENVHCVAADLGDPSSLTSLLENVQNIGAGKLDTIYIFHGIMSSGSEADFELGLNVNLGATLKLLEALRMNTSIHSPGKKIRIIYASSLAVYGQPLPSPITETTHPIPSSSYGAQKLACETILLDYFRKSYFDGLILRFPTVSIRPGLPTAAASSFLSGIIREPMMGGECLIPIRDREFKSWLCSPNTLLKNLVLAGSEEMDAKLGKVETREKVVNLPGREVSVREMLEVLEKVGGREKLALVRDVETEDKETVRILRSWGTRFEMERAGRWGFVEDEGFEIAVRKFVDGLKEAL